jgi:hypothetical protein
MLIEASFETHRQVLPLDVPPAATSLEALYAIVQQHAESSLGRPIHVELHAQNVLLPRCSHTAAQYGVGSESTVRALLSARQQETAVPTQRLISCEPGFGPMGGGTAISLRGEGFPVSSALHVAFGTVLVPAIRISSTMLQCRSPAQATAGPVTVRLHCTREVTTGGEVAFEYVRLERMYDAIFSSTNANCPVRERAMDPAGQESESMPWDAPSGSQG